MHKIASRLKMLLKLKNFLGARSAAYTPKKTKLILLNAVKNLYSNSSTKQFNKTEDAITKSLNSLYHQSYGFRKSIIAPEYLDRLSKYDFIPGREIAKNIIESVLRRRNSKNIFNKFFNYIDKKRNPLDAQLFDHIKRSVQDPNAKYIKLPTELKRKLLRLPRMTTILQDFEELLPHVSYKTRIMNPSVNYKDNIAIHSLYITNKPFLIVDDPSKYLYSAKRYNFWNNYKNGRPLFFSGRPQVAEQYFTGFSGNGPRNYIIRIPRTQAKYKGNPVFGSPHIMLTLDKVRLLIMEKLRKNPELQNRYIHNPGLGINLDPNYLFILDNTSGNLKDIATFGMRKRNKPGIYQANLDKSKIQKLVEDWDLNITK